MTDPFIQFWRNIKEAVTFWGDYDPPDAPDAPPDSLRRKSRLHWELAAAPPQREYTDLAEARSYIKERMASYAKEARPNRLLLVRAPAGLGKTWSAIEVAQETVGRVLFAMPTHEHWNTLAQFPHFQHEDWYHWLAANAQLPNGGDDEAMCRYAHHAAIWARKGYRLDHMCESLCSTYKIKCPYRVQSYVDHKIVAGVHEHVTTGLAITDFRLAIVDEEPTRAFLRPRTVTVDSLPDHEGHGPISEFMALLLALAAGPDPIEGPALMRLIAPLLGDVYAMIDETDAKLLPVPPTLYQASDVRKAKAWVLTDIISLLVPEYFAHRRADTDWLSRVKVGGGQIELLARNMKWSRLPARTIVLDATASQPLYKSLFPDREIEVVDVAVKPRGRVFQITGRYNGISQLIKDDSISEYGIEALEAVMAIANKENLTQPGVVTFKAAVPAFEAVLGAGNVAHFYGQRGSNSLEGCDGGFIIGSPSPSDQSTIMAATIINHERVAPFKVQELANGRIRPLRSDKLVAYNYRNENGEQPSRWVSGLWHDSALNSLAQSRRELELVQALHRFRPLSRDVPVWVLSSVPLPGITLSGIDDDPPIGPTGIPWQKWPSILRWLEYQDVITYQSLAEFLGMSAAYIKNEHWLEMIASQVTGWQIGQLERKGRGRKPKGLLRA